MVQRKYRLPFQPYLTPLLTSVPSTFATFCFSKRDDRNWWGERIREPHGPLTNIISTPRLGHFCPVPHWFRLVVLVLMVHDCSYSRTGRGKMMKQVRFVFHTLSSLVFSTFNHLWKENPPDTKVRRQMGHTSLILLQKGKLCHDLNVYVSLKFTCWYLNHQRWWYEQVGTLGGVPVSRRALTSGISVL